MKKFIALMLIFTLILPNAVFLTAFAADKTVTTGDKLQEALTNCKGGTITIEGTETLADGSKGIILPDEYKPVSDFYGTIIGVDGKNNIQLAKNAGNEKGLIRIISTEKKETLIKNLVLKGAETDGTGTIKTTTYSSGDTLKCTAALIGFVNKSTATVAIEDVINYVSIENEGKAGGFIAYVRGGNVSFKNCENLGNVTVTSTDKQDAGGFIGDSRDATSIISLIECVNYGNVTSTDHTGGIVGSDYGDTKTFPVINIEKCANYGNIESTMSNAAGIISMGRTATISECFNAGGITALLNGAGINAYATENTTVTDSYNLGRITITSLDKGQSTNLVGIARGTSVIVKNCYNVGDFSSENIASKFYAITNSGNVECVNNYYTTDKKVSDPTGVATQKTNEELEGGLEALGFSADVWEYIHIPDEYVEGEYSYPQIKGNTYWKVDKPFKNYSYVPFVEAQEDGNVDLPSGWEVEKNVTDGTALYKVNETLDETTVKAFGISERASYPGIMNSTIIRTNIENTSGSVFTINKSAKIYIAIDSSEEIVGFDPVLDNDKQVKIVTKAGLEYYLFETTKILEDDSNWTLNLESITGVNKAYSLFIRWIDNVTVEFNLSGNEKIYIENELFSGETYPVAKGSTIKVKIEPKQNYYIRALSVGDENEQNIRTSYEKELTVYDDITIKSETSKYKFIDGSFNYLLDQNTEGTEIIQSIIVGGSLENFLNVIEESSVTLSISKDGTEVASKSGTIDKDGKFNISIDLINSKGEAIEGECTLKLFVTVNGVENKIDHPEINYTVRSVTFTNTLIGKLNKVEGQEPFESPEEVVSFILDYKDSLPFNPRVFEKLEKEIKNKIASDLMEKNDYDLETLKSYFNKSVILNTLNMTKDKEDILRVLDTYPDDSWIIKNSEDPNDLYYEYEASDDKSGVCEYMMGVEYPDIFCVLPQFEYAFVKNKLSDVVSYDEILSEFKNYETLFGMEEGTVLDLLKKDINEIKYINNGIGESLSSLITKDDFTIKLNTLISEASQQVSNNNIPTLPPSSVGSGTSGTGGGGGGGGNISVSDDYIETPALTPVEDSRIDAFVDLGDVSWASDSISKLFYKGIIKGKESGKFCPQDKVTRAEFVKMAATAFNLEIENPVCNFTDLPKDHWAYKYVASMSDIGLISGYSATEFGTEESISRQDVIAILIRIIYRLAKYEEMENRKNTGVSFSDEKEIADYALGGVTMFAGNGIISGYEDGSFRPTQDLIRAEAAVILNNVIEFFRI